jgi:hypothetical protein
MRKNTVYAFEVNSLEKARQIPELISATERLETRRAECGSEGSYHERWIELQFKGQTEVLTGFLYATFLRDGCSPDQQCQHQQCQQSQSEMIFSNKAQSKIYYVSKREKIASDYKMSLRAEIIDEIYSVVSEGPFVVLDGGSAWKRFDALPYKSEKKTYPESRSLSEIRFATNGFEICIHHLEKQMFEGTDDIFCVIPLTVN